MTDNEMYYKFNVAGAGDIQISKEPHAWTGETIGFHFGVSWGKHGYAGGVMSRTEALELANHIIKTCSECKLSEEEELAQRRIQMV